MQLRRILLLFALIFGLSALVASIVPPPEEREEPSRDVQRPPSHPVGTPPTGVLRFDAARGSKRGGVSTKRAVAGARVSVEVSVPRPGDVTIPRVGLRQSGDPLAPARFDLLAPRAGRYALIFEPVGGRPRLAGRIAFGESAAVRPRAPGR